MNWLGLLLLLPVFLILTVLGVWTRGPRERRRMAVYCLLAALTAIVGCAYGTTLPGRGQHQLFPQVAAATLSFIGFVSIWALGLWWTRARDTQE